MIPYDFSATNAIQLAGNTLKSIESQVMKPQTFDESMACTLKPNVSAMQNQINFAAAYATRVLSGRFGADQMVKDAQQADGCFQNFLKHKNFVK